MSPRLDTDIDLSAELLRKSLHLAALLIPWGMLYFNKVPTLLILAVAAITALSLDLARARFTVISTLIHGLFGRLMRPKEIPNSKTSPAINGSTWVLIASFLLLLAFPARIASFSLVIFLIGDAASGIIGRKYGITSWRISDRTVEGTAAFLAVSLIAASLMPGTERWIGVIAAIFASAVEILPGPFNDNLQVPIATAGVIILLEYAVASGLFQFFS